MNYEYKDRSAQKTTYILKTSGTFGNTNLNIVYNGSFEFETFYYTKEQQKRGVQLFRHLGYEFINNNLEVLFCP